MSIIEIRSLELSPEKLKIFEDEFDEVFRLTPEYVETVRRLQEDAVFRAVTGLPKPRK